jgi:hypothetical protein
MSEAKLKRAHGNWVDGDRFWDREAELDLLIESLDEGAHLLIVAQRRIGKTSLMREAARRLTCLQVDLQKSHSPADAIVELSIATRPHGSLWEKTKGVFSHVLDKVADRIGSLQLDDLTVTLRSGVTSGDWRAVSGELTTEAALALARENATDGSPGEGELREILGILQHDGYFRKTDGGNYRFLSNLLKDWWKGHFGFGYEPWKARTR